MDIAIIGAGRLGTCLGWALSRIGFRIKAISSRKLSRARQSQKIIGQGKATRSNVEASREAEIVFICTPDEEISKISEELASSDIDWSKKIVIHSSGLLASEVLNSLKEKGAYIGSFHPAQSFPHKKPSLEQFRKIVYGLEGSREALSLSKKIVKKLEGHPLILKKEDKPLYHAACSIASNFFVVLLDLAISLLRELGIKEEKASEIILPLLKGTLQNVIDLKTSSALTGPLVRGEKSSIQAHLKALEGHPLYLEIYLSLAKYALGMAKREGILSLKKIKLLEDLLEDR